MIQSITIHIPEFFFRIFRQRVWGADSKVLIDSPLIINDSAYFYKLKSWYV